MLLQKYCSRIPAVHAAAAANTANQAAAAVIPQLLLGIANFLLLSIL